MRVAYFSPLPPSRSGIADYSEALIASLKPLVDLEVFSAAEQAYDPARFDTALYHVGNNGHHAFVYETALKHPGIVVMHESNLHHLMTDLTIKRGDWDAYVRECEFEGGPEALAFAQRVRRLEVGPDYEGVPMTRRILQAARGVVVHSRFMRDEVAAQGYKGPTAVIPHGAWIPQADRNGFRHRLGLDESTPLIGVFGFLKPYKRIAESLRAFRRLLRLMPNVKMILVGEPHPEFPVEAMIRSMGLSASVRVLGFAPIEDFVGYLGACDIVLNLRFPTVGESSGTLLRSLGLGKAVMVSEVGSFQEFPDDVCLKVPVGAGEEDLIFEYLNLLVSRPEVARQLGERARDYVARECNWATVAAQYAGFMEAVVQGREWAPPAALPDEDEGRGQAGKPVPESQPTLEYLEGWAVGGASASYLNTHSTRLLKTLEITPPGGPEDRVLEMGAYLQITPALHSKKGYGEVRGCYYGKVGRSDLRRVTSIEGETFECTIDHFDAEKDAFPYPDGHFATVICGELIEHLFEDPMHLMSEVNRILKPGGHFVITTPNIAALRGISGILQGYHPGFFHAYIRPAEGTGEVDARHNREYAPREIHQLLENSGFEVTLLETGEFRDEPHPEFGWIVHLLERYRLSTALRGDGIYAVGRKTGAVRERYPGWLYTLSADYQRPDVRLYPATRRLHATFSVRNDSLDTWRAADGFGVGYHLFDAATGTLIVDGARVAPPVDVKPGESMQVTLEVAMPAEDGAYEVAFSPMRENHGWYYQKAWPFLLVETFTTEGVARLDRVRVVTQAMLSRERALRGLGRAFVYPVTTVWNNWSLIRSMVKRDILGRYRGSFGGAFWTIINPLLLMLTYFFVFGVVLRDRYDPNASWSGFALYFLAGMLPWLAFSEAAGRAPSVMLEHRNFVKKLVFAVETLPVNLVVAGLITEFFAILLYCAFLLAINHTLPPAILWLPVLIVPQILFTAGISWFLAALGVFARDLGQIMGFILTLWFFLTPICYPENKLPQAAIGVLTKNPIYTLVHGYRSIFLYNQAPEFHTMWKLWLLSAAVCLLGHAWFYKLRKSFPDLL